jgi:cbb3-type cytochrome oxidase subunit 3
MLRDIFKSVGGIEGYGLVSMIIFVVFFALLTLHTLSLKKKEVEDYSRMPLDDFSKESDESQDI